MHALPTQWVPQSVILGGMFTNQVAPIPTMNHMNEYVNSLLTRFVRPHLATEVHVVFDTPGSMPETPKEIEQARRDAQKSPIDHKCGDIHHQMGISNKWRNLLGCQSCKRSLRCYLADATLQLRSPTTSVCRAGIHHKYQRGSIQC